MPRISQRILAPTELRFMKASVMKPAHKKIEKIDKHLRNKPLRGGNILYITQMNNSSMIQMTRPPFYIYEFRGS